MLYKRSINFTTFYCTGFAESHWHSLAGTFLAPRCLVPWSCRPTTLSWLGVHSTNHFVTLFPKSLKVICSQTWANKHLWIRNACISKTTTIFRSNVEFFYINYLWRTTNICQQRNICYGPSSTVASQNGARGEIFLPPPPTLTIKMWCLLKLQLNNFNYVILPI